MRWNELVTEGHVLSAQVRAASTPISLISIVAILLGGFVALMGDRAWTGAPVVMLDDSAHRERARQAEAFAGSLEASELSADAYAALAPAYELETVVSSSLETLSADGELPELFPFEPVSRQAFWSFDFPVDRIATLRRGDLIWVAARISNETRVQPFARRSPADAVGWVGVFRRGQDDAWSVYSLSGSLNARSLISAPGAGRVSPASIAPSLQDAAPGGRFANEDDQGGQG